MGIALKGLLHSTCYLLGYDNGDHVKMFDEDRTSKGKRGYEEMWSSGFQMPLHYPHYNKEDYQNMEEWKVDLLLKEYGLSFHGSLEEKRTFAMWAFIWPHQDEWISSFSKYDSTVFRFVICI